jgi:hypothetical protein
VVARGTAEPTVQGSDGVEQLAAVTNRGHTEVLQILASQPRQNLGVDVVVAERPLILL